MIQDEMTDRELLSYAEIHCRTELALFSKEHVERIFELAGGKLHWGSRPPFIGVHEDVMLDLVKIARRRMFAPGPYSDTGK